MQCIPCIWAERTADCGGSCLKLQLYHTSFFTHNGLLYYFFFSRLLPKSQQIIQPAASVVAYAEAAACGLFSNPKLVADKLLKMINVSRCVDLLL